MAVCCCRMAGTAACRHCSNNPMATDVWTNKLVQTDHVYNEPPRITNESIANATAIGPTGEFLDRKLLDRKQTNYDRIRAMSDEELGYLGTRK